MAEIINYRDFQKAVDRWANMEKLHLMRRAGLIPDLNSDEDIACSLITHRLLDTAPSEIAYDWQGGESA